MVVQLVVFFSSGFQYLRYLRRALILVFSQWYTIIIIIIITWCCFFCDTSLFVLGSLYASRTTILNFIKINIITYGEDLAPVKAIQNPDSLYYWPQ